MVESGPSDSVTTHVAQQLTRQDSSHILLATAWVTIHASNGRSLSVRALLDQGSESSFVNESVAQTLRLSRERVHTTVSGIGGSKTTVARSKATFTLSSAHDAKPVLTVTALVLPCLTSYVPLRVVRGPAWPHLQGLRLADPFLDNPTPVGLIIGSDLYGFTLLDGLNRGPPGAPIAQNTIFGWILSGPIAATADGSVPITRVHHTVTNDDLNVSLQQFFATESVTTETPRTEDEQKCSEHFDATPSRPDGNRYQVRLPFKDPFPLDIGQSLTKADACLRHLERRLARDPELSQQYHSFLDEYEALGHMVQVSSTPSHQVTHQRVYIPHHPVVKESSSTTRLRVVFNASSPTSSGTSLNDHMYTGPKLQRNLTTILMQWRSHKYVYSADIAKMYRQIAVDPRDRQYQCIRWRRAPDQEICTFELSTVTYGTAAAPFLALRVLAQLSHDEGPTFPLAKPILDENFYVDDVLFGADNIDVAKLKRIELDQLLERGGFHLRKWAANHLDLLEGIPSQDRESSNDHSIQESESIKVLGLKWHTETDTFRFQATVPQLEKITKRTVLSVIARLFDPLGWLAPIIITAKILMQSLWLTPSDWDSELPTDLSDRWTDYCTSLATIHRITIPRWTNVSAGCTYEIHGFADASTRAYAAVIYLCVRRDSVFISSTLLIAKTKVAPVKTLSVPRLELCAATLLSELLESLQTVEELRTIPSYGWTDSTIVLAWLAQHASTWRTFVANRIADIHRRHPNLQWGHVPSAENPADCASRGVSTDELVTNTLWWNGPHWLRASKTAWPQFPSDSANCECEVQANVTSHVADAKTTDWSPIDDISSWPRLVHVTAYCIKFIDHCQKNLQQGPSSLDCVTRARNFLVRIAQRTAFASELQALTHNKPIEKRSSIKGLDPSIDTHGVLRVGGRLSHSTLSSGERHPIILPHHRVTELIVQQAHQRSLHGGLQLTLRVLRQNFWILRARIFVRAHINKCVPCARERAAMPQQIMANLPSTRVTPSRPFQHCGVDYAGPILARNNKGRGHQAHKAYISVFVCFATRAIHLELVSDYSSATFIAALKRFVSRRGIPAALYSDNGTTFQGADKELRQAFHDVMEDRTVRDYLANDGISWYFLPPASPHMGGLWEAGVKSVKHHLRRIVGAKTLTNEELGTLLCQIEACLNSRPISPMTNDPEDFTPLTPGHFLTGALLLAVPEPSLLEINPNRLSRWRLVRQMIEQFWKRWATEYLHTLQQRHKWSEATPEIEPNDLVLLRNDSLPPAKWQLARVLTCHPGVDGHTRVVTIKTAQSEYKRPITQLCLLPVRKAVPA